MVAVTSRRRIIDFLTRRSSASADEIGRSLNMSVATVRHHLLIMAADGRIVTQAAQVNGKRGRPQRIYRLSDRLLGENLGVLSDMLLARAIGRSPAATKAGMMRSLAQGLRARMGETDKNLPLPKRLADLAERLNSLHYHARWEAGALGPRIVFGHCPYGEIITRHPELCTMDAFLLGDEMHAVADQLSKIDRKSGGATQCLFSLRLHGPGSSP